MGRYGTTTKYLLESLIPIKKTAQQRSELIRAVADANGISVQSLHNSFSRAIRKGLIKINDDGSPELTQKGHHVVAPFIAPTLRNSVLMIIFDIPEADRRKRDHLRTLLKELSFTQVQKSVWVTKYDHREYIKAEISALHLEKDVQLLEAKSLL